MGIEIEKYKENKISPYLYNLPIPFSYTGTNDNIFREFCIFSGEKIKKKYHQRISAAICVLLI